MSRNPVRKAAVVLVSTTLQVVTIRVIFVVMTTNDISLIEKPLLASGLFC